MGTPDSLVPLKSQPPVGGAGVDLNGQHWGYLPQAGDKRAGRKGLAPSGDP